jgi:uncharacterized membrane protein YgdD (TMEM256/DUF423 family)
MPPGASHTLAWMSGVWACFTLRFRLTSFHRRAMKLFVILGAVLGGLGVAAGAFGAHALRAQLDPRLLEVFETGARYQMYHALALFAVAWLYQQTQAPAAQLAGWAFIAGILLFSGSLYAMALTGVRGLGAITPFGGALFLLGWGALAVAAMKLG